MYYILKTTLQVINDKDTNVEHESLVFFDTIENQSSEIVADMLKPNLKPFRQFASHCWTDFYRTLEDWQVYGNATVYVDVFKTEKERYLFQTKLSHDWTDRAGFENIHSIVLFSTPIGQHVNFKVKHHILEPAQNGEIENVTEK